MALKIPEIPRIQGTIHMGDTFYLPFALYDDEENTVPTDLSGKTPTGKLLSSNGAVEIADFACAFLEATATLPKRPVVTLPSSVTSTELSHGKEYLGYVDLVDADGAPYRQVILELTAERV